MAEIDNEKNIPLCVDLDGTAIGFTGLAHPWFRDGIEIGWRLRSECWGSGYATEAGRANMEWAFANHDVDELVSVILPENTPSQAVARRLGFTLREERVLSFFPSKPHGIWFKPRP